MDLRMPAIYEYTANKPPRDLSFLVIGDVLMPSDGSSCGPVAATCCREGKGRDRNGSVARN